tara:strand:+ start:5327 stop:6103 length:777 start_codon:yes stop_codon:yes gene_type:complete
MVGKISLNDSRYKYHYKGFCSIINQIIDIAILHNKLYGDYNINIEDNQILSLFNVKTNNTSGETYDAGVRFLDEFFGGNIDNSNNAHTIPNQENLLVKNETLNSILEIKPEIEPEFKRKINELIGDEPFLGVQLRGTDKKKEIPETTNEKIIEGIDAALKETNLKKIFLATDDIKYVNLIVDTYGDEMVIINKDNIFSTDSIPIHITQKKHIININVLRDVYFLKHSSYICYTYSNVGYLAMIMGIKNIKNFKVLNKL